MRKLLLGFFLFNSLLTLQSQKVYHDLSNLAPIEPWEWPFTIENVIDVREDKQVVGYILGNRYKEKTAAYLNDTWANDLDRLLKSGQNLPTAPSYILRINRLFTYEVMHGSRPMAVTDLNVSFIADTENGYEHVFQAMATISEPGKDATNWVGYSIEQAFKKCFNDFEGKLKSHRLQPIRISQKEMLENPCGKASYPVHKSNELKKALYFDLYAMRDNNGDTTTTFYPDVRYKRKTEIVSATIDIPGDKKLVKSVFGFCDGSTVFIKAGRKFVPLKYKNGEMIIDSYEEDHSVAITSMIIGGVTGGVIGLAIAASINPLESADFWIVDFDRGSVIPNTQQGLKDVNAHTLIYSSYFNQPGDTLTLSVDGNVICELLPNQYYSYYSNSQTHRVEFCIEQKGTTTCQTIEPKLFETRIYVLREKRKGGLELGTLKGNAEDDLYKDLKAGRLERVMPKP